MSATSEQCGRCGSYELRFVGHDDGGNEQHACMICTLNGVIDLRDSQVADLLAACKLAVPFIEAVYNEHGREYLPNGGRALEAVRAAIEKTESA